MICKDFLPVSGLSLHFLNGALEEQNFKILMMLIFLSVFSILACASGYYI